MDDIDDAWNPVFWRNSPDWESSFQLDQANYCAERIAQCDIYGDGYNWYQGMPFTGEQTDTSDTGAPRDG